MNLSLAKGPLEFWGQFDESGHPAPNTVGGKTGADAEWTRGRKRSTKAALHRLVEDGSIRAESRNGVPDSEHVFGERRAQAQGGARG